MNNIPSHGSFPSRSPSPEPTNNPIEEPGSTSHTPEEESAAPAGLNLERRQQSSRQRELLAQVASRQKSDREYLAEWKVWARQPNPAPDENRQEALNRMMGFLEDSWAGYQLDLNGLGLTSLPENLLAQILELDVSDNQLTSLPQRLPDQLQYLYVSNNQLTSLPENLPASIQILDLSGNQLTSLPEHIATTLGPSCEVALEGNPIPEQVRNHFDAMFNTEGYQGPRIHFDTPTDATPARPLADAVADWHGEDQEDVTAAWSAFNNEDGAPEFSKFLDHLSVTVNYTNPEFRQGVVAWLSDLAGDPKLRKSSFAVSVDATASCQDRISLTYNDMKKVRLVSAVENGQYDGRLEELVQLARGMYRLDQLEKIAREKVNSLNFNSVDEIEVYLAYQVKLCEKLKLPLDNPDMLYFADSTVTDDDLIRAEAQVKADENTHFINYLSTDWAPWQAVTQRLGNTGFEETQEKVLAHLAESFEAQLQAGYAELDEKIDDASHRLEQLRATLPSEMPEVDVEAQLKPIEQERAEYRQQVQNLPAKLNKDMTYPIKGEAARALLQERGLPLSLLDPQW